MASLIMHATPFVEAVAPKLQTVYLRFLRALDAFAENRIRNAVSECEQRRASREIKRYRRMMNANRKRPAKTVARYGIVPGTLSLLFKKRRRSPDCPLT